MLVLVLSELIFFRDFQHWQNVHLFLSLSLDSQTGHLCFHPAAAIALFARAKQAEALTEKSGLWEWQTFLEISRTLGN